MTVRDKVYAALNQPSLTNQLPGGLFAAGSMTGSVSQRPWAVYRINDETSQLRGDEEDAAKRTSAQVWVYDEPGSFKRIEQILETVLVLMKNASGLRTRWLGTSAELPDDEFKAIVKYATFQVGEIQDGN